MNPPLWVIFAGFVLLAMLIISAPLNLAIWLGFSHTWAEVCCGIFWIVVVVFFVSMQ
ncbi:uncharacterized protein METZ01_LOCUS219329 [marine metagenome]|uniref:Uncharacterized protein n=1 Tax=marine metagenome TaxID=408172 RepID=A0A382FVA0_9ZZZZ